MKLAELLRGKSGEVFKVRTDQSIAEAATLMAEKRIGALLVEDDAGQIVGILSERDIVRGMGPHGADLHDVAVAELMTRNLVRAAPEDTINQAMAKMTDRRFRHLPVFDGDALVGFVSIGDLVKYRMMEVQAESEALRAYITS